MSQTPTISRLEAYRTAQAAAKLRLEARQIARAPTRGRADDGARDRLVAIEIAAMRAQNASDDAFARLRRQAA